MGFGSPTPPPAGPRPKPKRFGWWRKYQSEDRDPLWEIVAERARARLVEVICIKDALKAAASRAKKHGHIGDFDIIACAKSLRLEPGTVASVFRVLVDMEWLSRGHIIVSWLDEQPLAEDPTAAERQRNKRRRDEAKRRAASGTATEEDLELLSKVEQEQLAQLAAVVAPDKPIMPIEPERIPPFVPITPWDEAPASREVALAENERTARRWLFGDGISPVSFGPACSLIRDHYGCNRINADAMLRRWLTELDDDAFALAQIISGVHEHGVREAAFRATVEQRIAELIRERTVGLSLPLMPPKPRRA